MSDTVFYFPNANTKKSILNYLYSCDIVRKSKLFSNDSVTEYIRGCARCSLRRRIINTIPTIEDLERVKFSQHIFSEEEIDNLIMLKYLPKEVVNDIWGETLNPNETLLNPENTNDKSINLSNNLFDGIDSCFNFLLKSDDDEVTGDNKLPHELEMYKEIDDMIAQFSLLGPRALELMLTDFRVPDEISSNSTSEDDSDTDWEDVSSTSSDYKENVEFPEAELKSDSPNQKMEGKKTAIVEVDETIDFFPQREFRIFL
ncbi:hypothetical protein PUN28_014778 [Cardiocondyla obscurior]|uniref:Uncharacterized protein n=1 Tax=Cardiocondyla obscurior TaxID=286306 RepID=A0AAW2EZT2_9HYME